MPRSLPAKQPTPVLQPLKNITITNLCALKSNAMLEKALLEREITHQGTDNSGHRLKAGPMVHDDPQQLIAAIDSSGAVAHDHAIGIAIKRHAQVRTGFEHLVPHRLRMGCTTSLVDVGAVGFMTDPNHLSAQLMQHRRCYVVGRSVGCIDHDLHAPQVKPLRKAALTKLDISPCSVIDAPCSTHLRCGHTTQSRVRHRIAFQVSLDTRFNRIG